jgi:hypothetical protein
MKDFFHDLRAFLSFLYAWHAAAAVIGGARPCHDGSVPGHTAAVKCGMTEFFLLCFSCAAKRRVSSKRGSR